ncbi:MAG: cupredoxin domain-containing protein [Dehalococcoidia bacterium]|nr:cupredoxin domain-containing protein [Dehalococcoidia bacterium]
MTPRRILCSVAPLTAVLAILLALLPAAIASPVTAPQRATVTVSMVDNAFQPQTIIIQVGDTVVWTNNGALPHTSTSDTAGIWDSGTLSPGQAFSRTFDTAGTFPYHSTIHQALGMVGTVIVQAAAQPTATSTPAAPTPTATAAAATPTPTAIPTPDQACPSAAPFFPETGYCIDNPQIAHYFQARGGVDTFGLPASRTFKLLGFTAQVFQRHILRVHPDGVKPMNLLDPDVLPVTTVNFATFPAHDPGLATSAPPPNTANYGQAVLSHLQATVPESFEGENVQFLTAYLGAAQGLGVSGDAAALVALEIWGFPTSHPARDPNNTSFIYQRFQRGILHSFADPNNPAARVTRGILLADNLKFVLTNDQALLPSDLRGQVQLSRFFNEYCPNNANWVCRPDQLPDTDLTRAFEKQRQ